MDTQPNPQVVEMNRWNALYNEGLKDENPLSEIDTILNAKKSEDLVDLNPLRDKLVDSVTGMLVDGFLPHEDDSAKLHGLTRNALEKGGYNPEDAQKIEAAIFAANLNDLATRYPVIKLALKAISFKENPPDWVISLKDKASEIFKSPKS